ncbi:MAG: MarR family winged helix-turn-helix transcriptional regulator [Lachnospiraceae bacterium]|nr:MarR family winged helix-turn-helix transcriptional regulator [Lachnospiraceae bacterium]
MNIEYQKDISGENSPDKNVSGVNISGKNTSCENASGENTSCENASGEDASDKVLSVEEQTRLDTLSDLMNYTCHFVHHYSGRRGQGKILGLLSRQGPMTQHDLQSQLCIQSGSVSEILTKLENAGFITRTRDAADRRRCIIAITDAGRKDLEEHDLMRRRMQGQLYRDLEDKEQEELIRILRKLHQSWKDLPPAQGHCRKPRNTGSHPDHSAKAVSPEAPIQRNDAKEALTP